MTFLAVGGILGGVFLIGFGGISYFASMMSDAPTDSAPGGCIAVPLGLVFIAASVWSLVHG